MPSAGEKKRLRRLRRRKGRAEAGLFLAEGPHLVAELLAAARPVAHVLYTGAAVADPEIGSLVRRAESRGIRCERVTDRELAEYADTVTPQGILAAAPIPSWDWADVRLPRYLVLDGVQDPGNVGTAVRTAEALGAGAVICLEGTADPWGPRAARATAGASLRLPVVHCSWPEARTRLGAAGVETWAATVNGTPLARSERPPDRLALVLGSEGSGISPAVLRDASREVAIELAGDVESLNVAIAAAILMDRLFRSESPGDD